MKKVIDQSKWNQAWFVSLSPKMKCVWMYIWDHADHAGIWKINLKALSFFVGEEVLEAELSHFLGKQLALISADELLILSFSDIQYGPLNPSIPEHKAVLLRLVSNSSGAELCHTAGNH